MPIKSVIYRNKFPTVQFGYEEFEMYGETSDGQTPKDLYREMHVIAKEQHQENYPGLVVQKGSFPNAPIDLSHDDEFAPGIPMHDEAPTDYNEHISEEERIIIQIEESDDVLVVETFWLFAKKYPSVKAVYDRRIKELKSKKKK